MSSQPLFLPLLFICFINFSALQYPNLQMEKTNLTHGVVETNQWIICRDSSTTHSGCFPSFLPVEVLVKYFMHILLYQGPPLPNCTLINVPYLNICLISTFICYLAYSFRTVVNLRERGYWDKTDIYQQLFGCINFPYKKFYFNTQF